jgi:hypothetical protein
VLKRQIAGTSKIYRSSVTGKFVTAEYAKKKPATTFAESIAPPCGANQSGDRRRAKLQAVRRRNNEKFRETYLFLAEH